MKLTQRELQLLSFLVDKKATTAQQLSFLMNVSVRTVKSDIKGLKDKLNQKEEVVVSKSGKGYAIARNHQESLNELLSSQITSDKPSSLIDRTSRLKYLVDVLIIENQKRNLAQLSYEMYVSESALKKDIQAFRDLLAQYEVNVTVNSQQSVIIEGDEINLRNLIFDFVRESKLEERVGLSIKSLKDSISGLLLETPTLKYSNYAIAAIAKHTAIMVLREEQGYSTKYHFTSLDQSVLDLTLSYLHRNVLYKKRYVDYLYVNFLTKQIYDTDDIINKVEELPEVMKILVNEIKITFDIDIYLDSTLYRMLMLHIAALIVRIREKLPAKNKISYEHLRKHLLAVKITISAFEVIERFYKIAIDLDEFVLLVYYFNAIVKNQKVSKVRTIGFLNMYGRAEELMYFTELSEAYVAPKYRVLSLESVKEFRDHTSEIDVLVTDNQTLTHDAKGIPIIHPDFNLIANIRYAFHRLALSEIDLSRYFSPDYLVHNITGNSKKGVMTSIDDLFKNLNLLYESDIPTSFRDVELGNGVVMIQDTYNRFKKPIFFVGFLESPIIWSNRQVSVIVLIKTKKDGDKDLIYLNKLLSDWLNNTEAIIAARNNNDYLAFLSRLLQLKDVSIELKGRLK